jgi:hypothetical protein
MDRAGISNKVVLAEVDSAKVASGGSKLFKVSIPYGKALQDEVNLKRTL